MEKAEVDCESRREETDQSARRESHDLDQIPAGHMTPGQRSVKRQRSRYPINMMQACVECYQNFFHIYTTKKVLQSEELSSRCMESLTVPQDTMRNEESDSVLDSASDYSSEDHIPSTVDRAHYQKIVTTERLSEAVITTFKHACKLLSEFSNFPIYCTDIQKALKRSQSNGRYLWNFKYYIQSM